MNITVETDNPDPDDPMAKATGRTGTEIRRKRRDQLSDKDKAMVRACERMLDGRVREVSYPGGRSRDAVVLLLEDGREVVATKRGHRHRAVVESRVLGTLARQGTPAPRLLGYDDDRLLLQEKLQGPRLAQAMHTASPDEVSRLLDAALAALSASQRAGSAESLEDEMPPLGGDRDWIDDFLRRPLVIGGYLQARPRRPRIDELRTLLRIRRPRFIKWDARPGNAIATTERGVAWFDWEHCGVRNRIDDAVWLLADEFTPDDADVEERLLDAHIEAFADGQSTDAAREYFYAYGVFHSVVRLGLILSYKKDEPWWDTDYCLAHDKAGVSLDCVLRLAARARRWAGRSSTARPLADWFDAIGDRLREI